MLPDGGAIGDLDRKGSHLQSSEGCEKGTMFFLPLPLQNTLDRLDKAGFRVQFSSDDIMSTLPDNIVDGRPTQDKVVWQSLVDVDNMRRAVEKFRDKLAIHNRG